MCVCTRMYSYIILLILFGDPIVIICVILELPFY